jgi:hypothetical protein
MYAGVLFAAIGAGFAWASRSCYPMGTLQHMGPAYFPFVLGLLLTGLGVLVVLRGLTVDDPSRVRLSLRPLLFIIAGAVVFALLLEPLGLVSALAGLIFVSAFAGREFRFREAVLLWAALTVLAVAVFIFGLGLPFTVWPV